MTASIAPGTATEPLALPTTPVAGTVERKPDVQIVEATKRFGSVPSVDRMNLSIASGEFYSLLGPPAVARRPRCE